MQVVIAEDLALLRAAVELRRRRPEVLTYLGV